MTCGTLVADVCLISRKSCQRRPDSLLGMIRYWVLNCKNQKNMNSVDLDQTPRYLGLHCLPRSQKGTRHEWVNIFDKTIKIIIIIFWILKQLLGLMFLLAFIS